MDTFLKVLIGAIIAIFGAIIGVYTALNKHTSNPKKHVCSDDVVFRDVCDVRHKGLEDCIEAKLETLETKIDEGFKRVEGLIKNAQRRTRKT